MEKGTQVGRGGGDIFELSLFLGRQALVTGSEKNLAQLKKCVLPSGLEKKVEIFRCLIGEMGMICFLEGDHFKVKGSYK